MSFKVAPCPSGKISFAKDDVVIIQNERIHLTENGGRTWIEIKYQTSGNLAYHNGDVYSYGPHGIVLVGKGSIYKMPSKGICFLDDGTLVSAAPQPTIHFCEGTKWRRVQTGENDCCFRSSSLTSLRNNGFICILEAEHHNVIVRTYDKGITWIKNYTKSFYLIGAIILERSNGDIFIGDWHHAGVISGSVFRWCSTVGGPLTHLYLRDDIVYGTWNRTQFHHQDNTNWHRDNSSIVPLNLHRHLDYSNYCLRFGDNIIAENAFVCQWTDSGCIVATSGGAKAICIDWSVPNYRLFRSTKQKKIRNILLSFRQVSCHFLLFLAVAELLY